MTTMMMMEDDKAAKNVSPIHPRRLSLSFQTAHYAPTDYGTDVDCRPNAEGPGRQWWDGTVVTPVSRIARLVRGL